MSFPALSWQRLEREAKQRAAAEEMTRLARLEVMITPQHPTLRRYVSFAIPHTRQRDRRTDKAP